jgi:predicted LPLAT superfamily acyltransferase
MNEFSVVSGMKLMFWICKVFGRWPFRLVLYPVLLWYVMARPAARHASQNYLRHLNNRQPTSSGLLNVLRHFAAFAEMMLDKMLLWSGRFNAESVEFFGTEPIRQMISAQRGAVLICSHLGNLDLCRVLSANRTSLKLTILVHTKHAEKFNQMLASLNPASEVNLLQVTEITPVTAMLLSERVAKGEFVVIAGDRIPVSPNPRVVLSEFLGELAPFPVGPYILASVLQCPLFMLFSMRCNKGAHSHEIHFSLLRESLRLPRRGREQMLAEVVADYAQQLEQHCLNTPMQWFNFYDYWHLPQWNDTDAKH